MKALQYASDVLDNKIPTCKWVKLAVQRHVDDLKHGADRGLFFDEKAGERAITFFTFLKHWKGEFAGQTFELLPWQQFMIYVIYGWKRKDGTRRFRSVYCEVSRKNGKTTLSGGCSIMALIADGEQGAEVYTTATTRSQAKIAFSDAKAMVQGSPDIKQMVEVFQHNLHVQESMSKLEPLSSEHGTLDGLNPHFALVDEYHAHKDSGLYDVIESALGSRMQPMIFTITTAGFNKMGPCYAYRKVCTEILEGIKQDDSQFCIIYTLDKDDNWQDETTWIKANPSLGSACKLDYLQGQVLKAKNSPDKLVNLLTKNFNIWTDASEVWIEDKHWVKCGGEILEDSLRGVPAYGGLDLATVRDLNAFSLVFIDELEGKYKTFTWFWLPMETMIDRVRNDGVRYDLWAEQGYIKLTEGNVTDYRTIKADIIEICSSYQVEKIGYDRFNSSQLVIELIEEGLPMEPYGQGFVSMSQPSKTFETWVMSSHLLHNENPVMRWCLSNVELSRDPAGNIKPDKKKSKEKIDGIVSLIIAIGIMLVEAGEMAVNGPSRYEDDEGGLTVL